MKKKRGRKRLLAEAAKVRPANSRANRTLTASYQPKPNHEIHLQPRLRCWRLPSPASLLPEPRIHLLPSEPEQVMQDDRTRMPPPCRLSSRLEFEMNPLDSEPMMSLDKFIEQTGLSAVTVWRYEKMEC